MCFRTKFHVSAPRQPSDPSTTFLGQVVLYSDAASCGPFFSDVLTALAGRPVHWPTNSSGDQKLRDMLDGLREECGLKVEAKFSAPLAHTERSLCARLCGCFCLCRDSGAAVGVRRSSSRFRRTIFLHVSVSVARLLQLATKQEAQLLLDATLLEKADVAFNKELLQSGPPYLRRLFMTYDDANHCAIALPDDQLAIPGSATYQFISAEAKHVVSKETGEMSPLLYVYGHTKSVLSDSDSLKIVFRTLSDAGVDLDHAQKEKGSPLIAYFPAQNVYLKKKIKARLRRVCFVPGAHLLSKLRYTLGEQGSFYFAFLTHLAMFMLLPAVLGVAAFVRERISDEKHWTPLYGVFNAAYSTVILEVWKRKQASLATEWGMTEFEETEQVRPRFARKMISSRSPVTGAVQPHISRPAKAARMVCSFTVIGMLIIIILVGIISTFALRVWLTEKEEDGDLKDGWARYITATINALQIQIMGQIYKRVARALTEMEAHKTQSQFVDSLVAKTTLFDVVNSFSSLFWIAFFKNHVTINGSAQDCEVNSDGHKDCVPELQTQVLVLLLARLVFGNLNELIVPWLKAAVKRLDCGRKGEDHLEMQPSEDERQVVLPTYDTHGDYSELFVMFGYAALWSVFPLAPALVVLNFVIEAQLDGQKIFSAHRRPVPHGAQDIGVWLHAFEVLSFLAVTTTLYVAIFTSPGDFFGYSSTSEKLLVFLVLEHSLLAIKFLMAMGIRNEPTVVRLRKLRCKHLVRKHLKKQGMAGVTHHPFVPEAAEFDDGGDGGSGGSDAGAIEMKSVQPTVSVDNPLPAAARRRPVRSPKPN